MPSTCVYIDGFNLFYGIIKPNDLQWLDLGALAQRLNDGKAVAGITYCTARVGATPDDPDRAHRQAGYLRAIVAACPVIEIMYGQFSVNSKYAPQANCTQSPVCKTKVAISTEKGSDVNLASHLVHDAHLGKYDRAIVLSGDSDLVEPIRLVVKEIGKRVDVWNPRTKKSKELESVASNYWTLQVKTLAASQLPDTFKVADKSFTKPAAWNRPVAKATKMAMASIACAETGCSAKLESCRWQ